MNNIHTRLAGPGDASLIAALSRETFFDTFAKDNTEENMNLFMTTVFAQNVLIKEVENGDGIFMIAFARDEPVGYARLRERIPEAGMPGGEGAIEIGRLYARKEWVGKGAGAALMQHCLRLGAEKGKQWIWLGVWEKNERAIAFYEAKGFEKFGEQVFMLGNDAQTDWLMRKKL